MSDTKRHRRPGGRYSARTSIVLWLVLAGVIWFLIGSALVVVVPGGGGIEAENARLSKIRPAAAPDK